MSVFDLRVGVTLSVQTLKEATSATVNKVQCVSRNGFG